ncbi:hypothetical protein EYF80_059653 [Liparis tanakae]|uniref:Uncharacterized protein n=1 Tax=Liparis tanakae TaxID=230148 RepID=A0A4Z2EN70_9TELE|nr:hypothetical protein EYF80_059653 [Liparis tanakae]
MGTWAGRDRALQESSRWGDTERDRCWTGRCCSGTASVLPPPPPPPPSRSRRTLQLLAGAVCGGVPARQVGRGLRQRDGGGVVRLQLEPMRSVVQQRRLQLDEHLREEACVNSASKALI